MEHYALDVYLLYHICIIISLHRSHSLSVLSSIVESPQVAVILSQSLTWVYTSYTHSCDERVIGMTKRTRAVRYSIACQ